MFKSLKRKPEKLKEKLDFKLGFHATRVPLQGWDKLVISVIPYETGRPVAKTPRAVVNNGECHWPDSIIETTRMVFDTRTNLYEEKKYRFMVSSGSSRSGVLGEVTINLGDFAASKHPIQKGLALRNCTTGTLLHVTVTCLTPKSHDSVKDSERATKAVNDADEEESVASDDDDRDKLNRASSNGHIDSPRKSSLDSPPLSPSSGTRKMQQRGISTSSLRYSSSSFDSLEVPSTPGATSFTDSMQGYPGENLSSSSSFASLPERLDRSRETVGPDSKSSSPIPNLAHKRTLSSSAASVGNHQASVLNQVRQIERNQVQGDFREASGSTLDDLRNEVTTSKRQSLKLSGEVEELNRKLEKTVQVNKEKETQLSALTSERDGLRQEIEKLKLTKTASRDPEIRTDESRWAVDDAQRVIQELKEEIMLEKTTISSLNEQLQKTQQYNMKLVSDIDELLDVAKSNDSPRSSEESLAQLESDWTKKFAAKDEEVKNLQARILQLEERNSQIQKNGSSPAGDTPDSRVSGLQNMVKQLQQDVEELEADTVRLTDENTELLAKLEASSLELAQKSKSVDELKLLDPTPQPRALDNLVKQLQKDVEELEADTNRLTDENAELRAKLEQSSSELDEKVRLIADLKASDSSSQTRAPDNLLKQLQKDVEELEADTNRLTEENEELRAKLEQSNSELNEKSRLIADLKASDSSSQTRAPDNLLKQLQKDVEELETDTNRLTDENAELLAKLEQSNSELNEKSRLIADLKASDSSSQTRAPDSLLKQLQKDVEELEADTNRLTDENAELRTKLESSNLELSEKSRLIAELKASEGAAEDRAQLLAQIVSLEGELNRLKEGTTQILSEKGEAEKSIQRLQTENEELQKSIKRIEGSQPENFGRVQEREVANNQLFQQLAETVTSLEEELQESQEESRLSRLRTEELEREILKLSSSGSNPSSTELESLRKLLETEKLDKENIQRSAEERTRVNQQHLDHALEESESLKAKLEDLLVEMRSAEERAAELETAKTILESKLAALEEEKIRISNRVSGLELQLKYMTEEWDKRQLEAGVVEEEKSFLLSERERLQKALDTTTKNLQDLVRHLTEELDEAIKECEVFKSSQHQLEQEVMRLQEELDEAHLDLEEHTKTFENSRAVLEESFNSISRDHANAVAVSKTLESQVLQLKSDLEDMEMRSATEVRTLSMLKESEQHRAEKAEQALQQSAILQKANTALEKRVAELELLLEDERASQSTDKNGTTNGNGNRNSRNGHESHEGGRLKVLEMEKIKQEFMEKELSLLNEIERLELANEQLIQGAPDSDLQQLQMELTRLQNQNGALNRHIKELQSQLNTQDMLQTEVERLQEVNEKLDNRLQKYKAAASGSDMVEKVVHLETELAEAMEANVMYKSQLRSAFAEQQNVHAAALQNFGDVDTVVNDLVELRKRVKQLEGELRDMRDRYSSMSLRFAEVEVEREELVMTIRTLRNTRR